MGKGWDYQLLKGSLRHMEDLSAMRLKKEKEQLLPSFFPRID
jgi:hypothetical protein